MISFSTGCLFFEASTLHSEADCVPQWMQIGPAPLIPGLGASNAVGPESGMVRDIAIDPRGSTDQTIYVATDSGGVWKTTGWRQQLVAKIRFHAFAHIWGRWLSIPGNPSIVYAGSGNEDNQLNFFWGAGSISLPMVVTIGRQSWVEIFLQNIAINRIVFTAPNVLLVATGLGIYRSIDGGAHFGSNSPRFDDTNPIRSGNATDLDVDTASSNDRLRLHLWFRRFQVNFESSGKSSPFRHPETFSPTNNGHRPNLDT